MGRKQIRRRKYLLFYFAYTIIILFFFKGCTSQKEYQNKQAEELMIMNNHNLIIANGRDEQGEEFIIRGEYQAALEKNQEMLKSSPQMGDLALFRMGLIYANPKNPDKNYEKSLAYFYRLIKEFPESNLRNQAETWASLLKEMTEKDKTIIEQNKKIDDLMKKINALQEENETILKKINILQRQKEKLKEIDLTIEEKKRKSIP